MNSYEQFAILGAGKTAATPAASPATAGSEAARHGKLVHGAGPVPEGAGKDVAKQKGRPYEPRPISGAAAVTETTSEAAPEVRGVGAHVPHV